jgi:hypothetical protein
MLVAVQREIVVVTGIFRVATQTSFKSELIEFSLGIMLRLEFLLLSVVLGGRIYRISSGKVGCWWTRRHEHTVSRCLSQDTLVITVVIKLPGLFLFIIMSPLAADSQKICWVNGSLRKVGKAAGNVISNYHSKVKLSILYLDLYWAVKVARRLSEVEVVLGERRVGRRVGELSWVAKVKLGRRG